MSSLNTLPALLMLLALTSLKTMAAENTPFQIPRTSVVEIKDPKSQEVYPLFIKLPKSYRKNSDVHYPVIYLTDAWYAFQIVSGATRYPMNVNKMKEAIIVGISYAKGLKGDASRVRDYTPSINKSWKQKTGGAQQHLDFIENNVINFIDNNYRTDPSDRTFIGNSLGGLFGTYILLTKPQLFKNYILGSPSYWFDNKFIFQLENNVKLKSIHANVFISVGALETTAFEGQHDMVGDAQAFYQSMLAWDQPNLKAKIIVIPEANHETAFPTTAIQGLHWIYSK
ncbi:alpha/beta hydrolase [Thalassotalea profundi]|uniref:Esterase n=1 Tax=Thalassotalea profundi TaxID=2036687 RepID=A0ABQ3J6Y4_9GAMM|nr:alpha/beta hydrolase-fold protein [Thalassotalea profundi]GHF02377.1 esterase [Thalassotalea profundi]